jgi:ribulose-5-phosphate 4-epimerase/fuculose-1-phosphate aldolase
MSDAQTSVGPISDDLRADIAAASRILAACGVVDAMGHVSIRHPNAPDRFLMPRAMAPALVMPDDIMEYDLDSVAVAGETRKGFIERYIHGEVYRARPDIMSVVHSHSPSVIPFGLVDTPMQAMFHNAAFLAKGVPVWDIRKGFGTTDMLVCDCSRGADLAAMLDGGWVALMRAHGSIACGKTLELAVFRAVYTEVNARIQHWSQALAAGGDIAALSAEEGALADVANGGGSLRAWELWRSEVRSSAGW